LSRTGKDHIVILTRPEKLLLTAAAGMIAIALGGVVSAGPADPRPVANPVLVIGAPGTPHLSDCPGPIDAAISS
jgi:hypothetical protein